MLHLHLFKDSPEYESRKRTPFSPPQVSIAEIHAAVPKHLLRKSTVKGLFYYARDILFTFLAYKLGSMIDPFCRGVAEVYDFGPTIMFILRWLLWAVYWHCQGVIMAGLWTLAHEAGHGTLSDYNWVNHAIGYTLHTFLLVPYTTARCATWEQHGRLQRRITPISGIEFLRSDQQISALQHFDDGPTSRVPGARPPIIISIHGMGGQGGSFTRQ